jgi:osmotically-inducible protein OsmY
MARRDDPTPHRAIGAFRDVTLGGYVGHKADSRLAEDLAADVTGVREGHNRIRVGRGAR